MNIKLLVDGGAMQPGPALSQKLGPAGINLGQVISKVNEATKDFKGIKVPVELEIDASTKDITVHVSSPPTSELLKKEFGITKGSGAQKKVQVGNASIEQIISIAKQKMPNLLAKDLKAAVKSVAGTCTSLGILIEGKNASEIGHEIEEGKYDNEINEERTETSPEKRKELDDYFAGISSKQTQLMKAEEAAKAAKAAEAEKEAEKKAKAAKPAEAKPAEAKKK